MDKVTTMHATTRTPARSERQAAKLHRWLPVTAAALLLPVWLFTACESDTVKDPAVPTPDGGATSDGGPQQLPPGTDCFQNPKTHFEIINACTNAEKVEKNPVLPKLLADGGLPPLP